MRNFSHMIFKQIKAGVGKNFAYIIADDVSREAAIVDPSFMPRKVLQVAAADNLTIKYLINTHNHFDHSYGNRYILAHTHAVLINASVVHDQEEIKLGNLSLKIIATPGHSEDSICILVENKLLTGDTLFIGDVGITSSKEDAYTEFNSLKKLLALDDNIEVYPGHDYSSIPSSSIGYEKQHNLCVKNVLADDFASFLLNK